jgi:predicted amidophosphoribosyltransferase
VRRQLNAKHIAIVDDVMTTGHTVNALALCLRKAGVERIDVWVVARA